MSEVLRVCYWVEPLIALVALCSLLRSKDYKRFPALLCFLGLHVFTCIALTLMWNAPEFFGVSGPTAYSLYFFTYWTTFSLSAILILFAVCELFQIAMEPLPGLRRLGSIAFRWVACVSMIAAVAAALAPRVHGYQLIVLAGEMTLRCESVFALCLLFFLMITAEKLGLSYRSRVFGVCFAFGVLAAGDLIDSALFFNASPGMVKSIISTIQTGADITAMLIVIGFFVAKEPARQSVVEVVKSPLARWNEIASALSLSHTGTRLASPAPTNEFFLQDVEKVVDRIMSKNSLNVAS